jgi:hypothetical protein
MSDLDKWDVRGRVRHLTKYFETWNASVSAWIEDCPRTDAWFRMNGQNERTETLNPDRSVAHSRWEYDDSARLLEIRSWMNDDPAVRTVYEYDQGGRHVRTVSVSADGSAQESEVIAFGSTPGKIKTRFLRSSDQPVYYSIEGADTSISAPGAATMTSHYDEMDLPVEVTLQDENRKMLRRLLFVRDGSRRLVEVKLLADQNELFPAASQVAGDPRLMTVLGRIFGGTVSQTQRTYDDAGRLVLRVHRMGTLGETRTTWRYGEKPDPVEETTETIRHEIGLGDDGSLTSSPPETAAQQARFEYLYDANANWTVRTVSIRCDKDTEFYASNRTRRDIEYH